MEKWTKISESAWMWPWGLDHCKVSVQGSSVLCLLPTPPSLCEYKLLLFTSTFLWPTEKWVVQLMWFKLVLFDPRAAGGLVHFQDENNQICTNFSIIITYLSLELEMCLGCFLSYENSHSGVITQLQLSWRRPQWPCDYLELHFVAQIFRTPSKLKTGLCSFATHARKLRPHHKCCKTFYITLLYLPATHKMMVISGNEWTC